MRQFPKIESPTEVPAVQPLHPVLSGALASLDIQLEEELTRYRRMRVNPDRTPRRANRRSASKPLDLIRVSGAVDGSPQVSPAIATPAQNGVDLQRSPLTHQPNRPTDHSVSSTSSVDTATIPPHLQTSGLAIAPQPSENPLASDPANDTSLSQEQIEAIAKPLSPQRLDDYLESSEELLKSLAEEEAAVQAERGFVQSLLTPLGAGSMLLLLLSSAMFGYLVMNPSSVGRLFTAGNNRSDGTGSNQGSQTGMISPQPNLAAQEFKDLNLNTLGTLKADSAAPQLSSTAPSSSAASPAPNVPPQPTVTSTRLGTTGSLGASSTGSQAPAPSAPLASRSEPAAAPPRQAAPPIKTYEPPRPARTYTEPRQSTATRPDAIPSATRSYTPPAEIRKSTPAPPVSTPVQTSSSSFDRKVVTHYDGDRTLEEVKKVVPDAYVRNFPDGARIQLGAFTNEADAEARAQQLRKQGISAEVYKP